MRSPPPRSPLLTSPTPVGEMGLPLLGSAKGGAFAFSAEDGVVRPSLGTKATAVLLDTWVPWLGYLGLGVGMQDFVLGSLVAGGAALLGLAFQAYRYHVQHSLRLWPKANPLLLALTWAGNAAFALLAPDADVVARYTLFVVISGALLANAVSLALGRPVLLEEAVEGAETREEVAHPRFVAMHTRASYALLALTCVQWPAFFLAAFVYYKDPVLAPILLLAVPVGSLLLTVLGISIYIWRQRRLLRVELDREAQLKPDGLVAQYTTL